MQRIVHRLVYYAFELASDISARVLIFADALREDEDFRRLLQEATCPTILVTRLGEVPGLEVASWISVPDIQLTRAGQVKSALLVSLARGLLHRGDQVICLTGADSIIDTLLVLNLATEPELLSLLDSITWDSDVSAEVFERTLSLAAQLAVEGREGRPVGALFVLGDSDRVLAQSRSLVLNPFQGHPKAERNILDPSLEETIKEFAALDGAFVVRGDGVVLTAGTQLIPSAPQLRVPGGLGTRHAAAAGITASTAAVAVCVSQSTGTVSVFKSGQLVTDIHRPADGSRLAI